MLWTSTLTGFVCRCTYPGVSRAYSRGRTKLSSRVSHAGKGSTILAQVSKRKGALSRRQQVSFAPKTPAVQPTTLDMGAFAKLHSVSKEDRTVHRNLLEKVTKFKELRIAPAVMQSIETKLLPNAKGPTAIQKVAIKALRIGRKKDGFKSWLVAAETGSGKTLAYLAPLLSNLDGANLARGPGPRISSIILVPTLELVSQVAGVVAQLGGADLRMVVLDSESRNSKVVKSLVAGADMVVATPDKVLSLAKQHQVLMDRALQECRYLVVDEADSLMNESFVGSTTNVIKTCSELSDLVFCTATIPRSFDKELRTLYPETSRLVTPSIHRIPRQIDFRVIETFLPPYRGNKDLALQQVLYSIYQDNTESNLTKRVVVFVNKKDQVSPTVNMLRGKGFNAIGLTGVSTPSERAELLEDFVNPPQERTSDADKLKVLVTTDLVARGVDMKRIRNVVLYDLPWSSADLLHRAGRTGRLNAKGRVILLVSKAESKGWVKGLEKIVKAGQALA